MKLAKLLVVIGMVLGAGAVPVLAMSWSRLNEPLPEAPIVVDCARVPALSVGTWVRLRGCRPLPDQAVEVIRVDAVRDALGVPDVERVLLPLAPEDPAETRATMYLAMSPGDAVATDGLEGMIIELPRVRYDSELQLERLRTVGHRMRPAASRSIDALGAKLGALAMLSSTLAFALAWLLGRRERRRRTDDRLGEREHAAALARGAKRPRPA